MKIIKNKGHLDYTLHLSMYPYKIFMPNHTLLFDSKSEWQLLGNELEVLGVALFTSKHLNSPTNNSDSANK